MHETKMHEHTSFVTFTYSEDNLPEDNSLNKREFNLFAKRLRKHIPFRYYHCGEYGDEFRRPHYHAILFGADFSYDRTPYKVTEYGHQLYISKTLDDLWEQGFCTIGEVNFDTASYVARYCMKKQTGKTAVSHYESIDQVTGEIIDLQPEYATMSLKPGIGAKWFERYHKDVYPRDEVYINGRYTRPPKYYDTLYERMNPEGFAALKAKRLKTAEKIEQPSAARQETIDICVKERLRNKKESLHNAGNNQNLSTHHPRQTQRNNLNPINAQQQSI